jgi:hypothetical protein
MNRGGIASGTLRLGRRAAAAPQGFQHIDKNAEEVELRGQPFFISTGIEALCVQRIDAALRYADPRTAGFDLCQYLGSAPNCHWTRRPSPHPRLSTPVVGLREMP